MIKNDDPSWGGGLLWPKWHVWVMGELSSVGPKAEAYIHLFSLMVYANRNRRTKWRLYLLGVLSHIIAVGPSIKVATPKTKSGEHGCDVEGYNPRVSEIPAWEGGVVCSKRLVGNESWI